MGRKRFSFLRRNPEDLHRNTSLRLHPGESVRIRSESEIAATLDKEIALEGLPFLPEMRKYCGGEFTVLKRVNKMLVEGESQMKRLRGTVILTGVVCEGEAHSGCQRFCPLLWREAWLTRVQDKSKRFP